MQSPHRLATGADRCQGWRLSPQVPSHVEKRCEASLFVEERRSDLVRVLKRTFYDDEVHAECQHQSRHLWRRRMGMTHDFGLTSGP